MTPYLLGSLVRLADQSASPPPGGLTRRGAGSGESLKGAVAALITWAAIGLAPLGAHAHTEAMRLPAKTAQGDSPAGHAAHLRVFRCRADQGAEAFARTELFFGLSRPGGVVTEEEFKAFIDTRVTPRFPDGLTVLSGTGQFRDGSGTLISEGSKLLILLYPRQDPDANREIEQIRSDYKNQFEQQSVLRSDDLSCVSF